jgi:hypothetical protein
MRPSAPVFLYCVFPRQTGLFGAFRNIPSRRRFRILFIKRLFSVTFIFCTFFARIFAADFRATTIQDTAKSRYLVSNKKEIACI